MEKIGSKKESKIKVKIKIKIDKKEKGCEIKKTHT